MAINAWTARDELTDIPTLKIVYASDPSQTFGKFTQQRRRGRGHRIGVLHDEAGIQNTRLQSAPPMQVTQAPRPLDSFTDLCDETDVRDAASRQSSIGVSSSDSGFTNETSFSEKEYGYDVTTEDDDNKQFCSNDVTTLTSSTEVMPVSKGIVSSHKRLLQTTIFSGMTIAFSVFFFC